jgi:GntP family gluconate:H+ symporter
MNLWLLVSLAVAIVLVCILVFRLHAFLTLLLAGLVVAALMGDDAVRQYTENQVARNQMTAKEAAAMQKDSAFASAPTRLATAFGETAGEIGILIALASIIGQCLMESRAAFVIVDRMLLWTGPKRAPEALAASSFLLGIPVFFDTVFYLMVPLARSLRQRLGKDYVLFILAIFAGGSISHSLVPPTPGPLYVAGALGIDVSAMLLAGLAIGGCSSFASLGIARLINRMVQVPLRGTDGADVTEDDSQDGDTPPTLRATAESASDSAVGLPSLIRSLCPIAVPVLLIAVGSVTDYLVDAGHWSAGYLSGALLTAGNKNLALAVGVAFALSLRGYCPVSKRETLISRSLASGGNIILITAAGGAFGMMLRQAGIGQAVGELAQGVPGLYLLVVAFLLTASIRTLQGSATVAMITAAGVLQGAADASSLPFHPVYLAMAIGAGSKPVSWMTDSGFWVMTRMSGMTESEGLRTISPMSLVLGITSLLFTILFATMVPGI